MSVNLTTPRSFGQHVLPKLRRRSALSAAPPACPFSTSVAFAKRADRNRGVSPMRRTGPGQRLSVQMYPLPRPVTSPKRRSKVQTDDNHGLWGFFNKDKAAMNTPESDAAYGRAWTQDELRIKSWEDLHALWWTCMMEINRTYTSNEERRRLNAGFGQLESMARVKEIKKTQRAIRQTLIERQYTWEDALKLAADDPSIDLSGEGPLYDPDVLEEGEEEYEPEAELEGETLPESAKPSPISEPRAQPVTA